uniref:Syntaxin 19 n=1 Tax=Mastacembelus armatus TaxID=205130 RepID=A0A3Q3N4H4_9TELE
MRDRLEELQQRAQEFSEAGVMFEEEPNIVNLLSEIHPVIFVVKMYLIYLTFVNCKQVLRFTQQQKTLVSTMRRFSLIKKDSSLTRDVKLQAEKIHRRLDAFSKLVQPTEDQQGPTAVTTRIQCSQYAALNRKFQEVGNMAERCKHFITRQLEVLGKDVKEEEVNEMFATGKWEVFNENLLNDARITRSQLSEIEQRHKVRELLSLENKMKELRDLFTDIFMLVEEQGASIEHIQTNVERTQDFVLASNEKFKLAARYKEKNPIRQLCCCCCPPWRCCL